ncbi:peptidase [Ensifer soli]|uniref:peptidase n=1 Tax=Ciceribacter sp. sgz301302 TaxID=3342379 RepID=UPI0035BB58C3
MKPFEIFRAGQHTSSQGIALGASVESLVAFAEAYDPAQHQAPIVIGHPKTNAPAWGWIKSLSVKGDRLIAEAERVDPTFAEMVREGRYDKRSIGIYAPASPGNPTPGQYHLRHVGFLGAEPPAVKGLAPIEFAEAEDGVITIDLDFAEGRRAWMFESIGRLLSGIRDHFIASSDVETADRLIPKWELDQLTQGAAEMRAEDRPASPTFSETETTGDPMPSPTIPPATSSPGDADQRLAEIEAREQKLAADQLAFSEASRKAQAKQDADFVDSIVKAGRLPIGLKDKAVVLFSELDDGVLTFSEGGTDVTSTPRAAFRSLLESLPVQAIEKELAPGEGLDFSDPKQVAAAIDTEIRDAKAKGEDLGPATAAMRLQNRR